jgi:hypothetical protein
MPVPSSAAGAFSQRAPAFILPLAALFGIPPRRGLHLRPRSVARGLGWCEHDYPRWGAHKTSDSIPETHSCSAHRLLSWGRSSHHPHGTGLRPFAASLLFPRGKSPIGSIGRNRVPILVMSAAPLSHQVRRLRSSNVFEHLLFHLLDFAIGMHVHVSLGARVLGHLL